MGYAVEDVIHRAPAITLSHGSREKGPLRKTKGKTEGGDRKKILFFLVFHGKKGSSRKTEELNVQGGGGGWKGGGAEILCFCFYALLFFCGVS